MTNNRERISDKNKLKMIIETYLNLIPYSTGTQLMNFLKKSSFKFSSEPSTASIGAVCRSFGKIKHIQKSGVKYYYIEEVCKDDA